LTKRLGGGKSYVTRLGAGKKKKNGILRKEISHTLNRLSNKGDYSTWGGVRLDQETTDSRNDISRD